VSGRKRLKVVWMARADETARHAHRHRPDGTPSNLAECGLGLWADTKADRTKPKCHACEQALARNYR
jgi:hypothetical protein